MKQTITLEESILADNDLRGSKIRKQLARHGIFGINIMASPGAGKTSLILKTLEAMKDTHRIGIIDGDVVDIDLKRMEQEGVQLALANTGRACHLDAVMVEKALAKLDLSTLDLLIVENVGNLICPANFYIGTHAQVVIASVPEGDDKPYKYPGMFEGADVVILNKIDYLDREDFNLRRFEEGVSEAHPTAMVLPLSCKTGEGVERWLSWLTDASQKAKT